MALPSPAGRWAGPLRRGGVLRLAGRDTAGLSRIRRRLRNILHHPLDPVGRAGRRGDERRGMSRLCLLTLLALLGGVAPAEAAGLELLSPRGEVWARPGGLLDLEVSGAAGVPVAARLAGGPTVHLAEVEPGVFRGSLAVEGPLDVTLAQGEDTLAVGPVRLLGPVLPVLEVVREGATYRSGPDDAFDRYDPLPAGYRSLVSSRRNDWLRLEPAGGWVHVDSVRLADVAPSRPVVSGGRVEEPGDGSARLRLRLGDPAPWQVLADPEQDRLVLWLPGAAEAMGEVMLAEKPRRLPLVRLEPSEQGVRVVLGLGPGGLWGYRTRWEAPDLVLTLAAPPSLPRLGGSERPLEGLAVAVDPGHGGDDDGAIGRDGRREKDVNLEVSLALRRLLEQAGARVAMTRDSDRSVTAPGAPADEELGARVRLAEGAGAQVFLSIHHNARPTVAEGRVAHGTHLYYYRPQSRRLAQALAGPLAAAVEEPDHAALWRSFHVIRQAGMPAVLVEVNFLSNPALEAQTRRPDYAACAAGGLFRGLLEFLRGAAVENR